MLSLNSFFRAKETESGRYAVLIYDKAFDGRHGIESAGRKLSQFPAAAENDREWNGLLTNRYLEVSAILRRMPTHDAELDRAHNPLPYFIEAPQLAWERAPENLRIQNGFMAFANLLKHVVLLGLTEAQARRKEWNDFAPPNPEVISGICGNPSLGHWSRCLDWVRDFSDRLPIFGGWINAMAEKRAEIINLTEQRNKYAHPSSVLERSFVDAIEGQLEIFFTDTVRKFRRGKKIRILLPRSRKALRRENETMFEFAVAT